MRKIILAFLSFALIHQTYGQTGPGGVGSSSNLELWLHSNSGVFQDAGTTSATNGTTVQQWNDLSGNNNNVSQSTSASRPTFNTGQINGLPVVTFDGTNDFMDRILSTGTYTTSSIFIVGQFAQASQGNGDHDFMFCLGNNHTDLVNISRGRLDVSSVANRYFSYTEGTFRTSSSTISNGHSLFTQRWNSSAAFHNMDIDGTALTVTDHGSAYSVGRNIRLGAMFVSTSNAPYGLNGDLAEVIFYDEFVNTTQKIIVENYLAAKYGLTIANDKYAHQAANGNEVAGIGQESAGDNHTSSRGASIVQISAASDLEDGEYMLWGHNGAGTGNNTTEVPVAYVATSGQRLDQEWRVDISGGDNTVGTVTISFDLTGITFGTDPADYRLITDADGIFTNGTVETTAPSVAGSLITFTGITLTDGLFFTIGNSNDIDDCLSLTSAAWASVIWSCGSEPDSAANVTISDATSVTVTSAGESVNDLILEADGGGGGGTLTLNDNATLIVKGDLTVGSSATLTIGSGARIIFRGVNGNQTFTNSSGSTITLDDLQVQNANGLTLAGGSNYELTGNLTLTNGNLTSNTGFTFLSSTTQTASIDPVPNNSILDGSGTYVVERFRSGRIAGYGDIGSSGVDTDLEDLNGEVFMSGITGGDGYAESINGGGFISVWYWDGVNDEYVAPASTAEAFTLGRGYEIWLADDASNWGDQAWSLRGDIHLDPINLPVNSSAGNEWNLLANPYLGFLDWSNITATSGGIVGNVYWWWDLGTQVYVSGSDDLPPGQGFWVQTSGITEIALDPANDLVAGQSASTMNKTNLDNELKVAIHNNDQPFGSAVYVRKDASSYIGFDENDVTPLRLPDARACHMSIPTGATNLMVNYIPADENVVEIPLEIDPAMAGNFTMTFEGLKAFSEYSCISLENDKGDVFSIDEASEIAINVENGDEMIGYKLVLTKDQYVDCENSNSEKDVLNSNVSVWSSEKSIFIDYALDRSVNSNVDIFNSLGELIHSTSGAASYNREQINLNSIPSGVYFVQVSINGNSTTEKVILQ